MNKKILLSLGTLSFAALPIVAVISCNEDDPTDKAKKTKTKEELDKINSENAKIDAEVSKKTAPTIAIGKSIKTADKVVEADVQVVSSDSTLTSSITKVEVSTTATDSKTVTVTVEVKSQVAGTKTGSYTYELTGFTKMKSWDKALPTGFVYESRLQVGEYTTDKTKAKGYVQEVIPAPKSIADITTAAQAAANKQVVVDGITYTWRVAGASWVQTTPTPYPSNQNTIFKLPTKIKRLNWSKQVGGAGFKAFIGNLTHVDTTTNSKVPEYVTNDPLSSTKPLVQQQINDLNQFVMTPPVVHTTASLLASSNAGDTLRIVVKQFPGGPLERLAMVIFTKQNIPAGFDKPIPTSKTYYETNTVGTYTSDKTKAKGYVAGNEPQAVSENDLKIVATASTSKSVKIGTITYKYQ